MKHIQLLYMSLLTGRDERLLPVILESAKRHNLRNEVTGMLLYFDGAFLQVLEGPEEQVQETFGRIAVDPNHYAVFKMDELAVNQRYFSEWTMGFQALTPADLDTKPALAALFRANHQEISRRVRPGTAASVLRIFSNGGFRLR